MVNSFLLNYTKNQELPKKSNGNKNKVHANKKPKERFDHLQGGSNRQKGVEHKEESLKHRVLKMFRNANCRRFNAHVIFYCGGCKYRVVDWKKPTVLPRKIQLQRQQITFNTESKESEKGMRFGFIFEIQFIHQIHVLTLQNLVKVMKVMYSPLQDSYDE